MAETKVRSQHDNRKTNNDSNTATEGIYIHTLFLPSKQIQNSNKNSIKCIYVYIRTDVCIYTKGLKLKLYAGQTDNSEI